MFFQKEDKINFLLKFFFTQVCVQMTRNLFISDSGLRDEMPACINRLPDLTKPKPSRKRFFFLNNDGKRSLTNSAAVSISAL